MARGGYVLGACSQTLLMDQKASAALILFPTSATPPSSQDLTQRRGQPAPNCPAHARASPERFESYISLKQMLRSVDPVRDKHINHVDTKT